MKKCLVTGGAGFIGSNIAKRLLSEGNFVRIVDNFSTGSKKNIEEFMSNPHIELLEGDLTGLDVASKAIKGIDVVFHHAAAVSVAESIENPLKANSCNITATLNLLTLAKEEKIKKFIYASSSSVYGNNPESPKKEDFPADPISPYALTKYTGEKYAQIFWTMHKLPTICLRYFNVFGPKQDLRSQYSAVIPKFINAFLNNKNPIVYGTGEQIRDFVYVDNVVKANMLAADSLKGNGEVFNIGTGKGISINQLIGSLKKITQVSLEPDYQVKRQGDVMHSVADIHKARQTLHYNPEIDFEDGLIETFHWYKKNE